MSRIHEIAERTGIPISDKSIEAAQVVAMIEGRGVLVGREAIYSVRSGKKTGDRLGAKLEMAETLRGTAHKKDSFYGKVGEVGIDVRAQNQRGHFSTINFSRGISWELDIADADVSRTLRAMRTDLVLAEVNGELPSTVDEKFRDAAIKYLSDYDAGYPSSNSVSEAEMMWDQGSIENFYRACSVAMPAPHSLRTWMPYEIEVLGKFYQERINQGSPLSALDRLTLEKNVKGTSLDSLVSRVRRDTGVPYDQVAHFTHTNALLFRQPTRQINQAS